jgi:branched-subunit amino acid ABC-type transport system permease component
VIQFAHPDVFMIGMFSGMIAAGVVPGGGLAVALIGGAVGSTAIGAVIERMVVAPLRGRDVLTTLIATLGVSVILQNGMAALVGPDPIPYPRLLPSRFYEIGPVLSPCASCSASACARCCSCWLAYTCEAPHRSRHPRDCRAPDVAAAFGVDVGRAASPSGWLLPWPDSRPSLGTLWFRHLRSSACSTGSRPLSVCSWPVTAISRRDRSRFCARHSEALDRLRVLLLRDAAAFFVLIGVLYFRPNGLFGSYAT